MQKEHNLSKNQKIIFDLIDKSGGPMKAYSILFNVQKKGIKAPLQVYRALDKLVEIGKFIRLKAEMLLLLVKILVVRSPKQQLFQFVKVAKMYQK